MKSVFIFGAGASRQAGAPLMADFLDRADKLARLRVEGVEDAQDAFELVREAQSDLQLVHAKSYLDLDNVETLFGAIEMGRILGGLYGRSPKETEDLRKALITVMVKTIERTMPFPATDTHVSPPRPYEKFVKSLRLVEDAAGFHLKPEFAFLTFNYDVALDYSLHHGSVRFDYSLDDKSSETFGYPLLKLHGSINWGTCQVCGQIVPYQMTDLPKGNLFPETRRVYFPLGSNIHTRSHCGKPLAATPVLVPPTWNKTEYNSQLSKVWSRAASELAQAENIFEIGYSLPESDNFFRYLFGIGTLGEERIKRLWVINPDNDGLVKERFSKMVGEGIRNRLRFVETEFENSIDQIRVELIQALSG